MNTDNQQLPIITGIAPLREEENLCYGPEMAPYFASTYIPEVWQVRKDAIYAAIDALQSGLEYAQQCLTEHDSTLGRTTRRNKVWAETIEQDIEKIKKSIKELQS